MADSAIEYKHELSFGDVLRISVQAVDFDKLGFDIFYLLQIINRGDIIMAGKAKTGMICYDYSAKKKMSIPEIAIEKLMADN